jgi:hypothetical protein
MATTKTELRQKEDFRFRVLLEGDVPTEGSVLYRMAEGGQIGDVVVFREGSSGGVEVDRAHRYEIKGPRELSEKEASSVLNFFYSVAAESDFLPYKKSGDQRRGAHFKLK